MYRATAITKKIRLREAVHQKDLTQSVFFQEKGGNHKARRNEEGNKIPLA
jgi:hypothetical protein